MAVIMTLALYIHVLQAHLSTLSQKRVLRKTTLSLMAVSGAGLALTSVPWYSVGHKEVTECLRNAIL